MIHLTPRRPLVITEENCTVRFSIPAHAAEPQEIRRMLAAVSSGRAEMRNPASTGLDLEVRCSVEAAMTLVEQLCALRHTRARGDTRLLTACADAVAVVHEALDRTLCGQLDVLV
jgi:hypothetical protein